MRRTQSSASANGATSFIGRPSGPANGAVCAAAVITAPAGSVARSTRRNSRKFAASCAPTWLPAFPACPGYSQSRSIPSSENCR